MKTSDKRNVLKKVVTAVGDLKEATGKARILKAQAAKIRAEGKANKLAAKASVIREKQGIAKTRARAAAFSASVASASNAMAARNASDALAAWTKNINGSDTPAEGTGEPSNAGNNGQDSTTGTPLGNYSARR